MVGRTDGVPPYQGRMKRAMMGWTWKRKKALMRMVRGKGMGDGLFRYFS